MEFWFHYFIKQIVTKLLICAKPFYWELDRNGVMNESFPAGDHNLLEKAKALQHYRNTLKGDAQTPRGGVERPRKATLPDTQPKLQFSKQSGIMGRSELWMLRNLGSVSLWPLTSCASLAKSTSLWTSRCPSVKAGTYLCCKALDQRVRSKDGHFLVSLNQQYT